MNAAASVTPETLTDEMIRDFMSTVGRIRTPAEGRLYTECVYALGVDRLRDAGEKERARQRISDAINASAGKVSP